MGASSVGAIPLIPEVATSWRGYPLPIPNVDIDAGMTHTRPMGAILDAPMATVRPRVLFLCTHNSARSQMAEGLLRAVAGDCVDALSAGTEQTEVRPEAIAAMAEIGIDIGAQHSKTLERFRDERIDWLVTVCDQAREACPILPGVANQRHWSIADPAAVQGDGRLDAFRAARDELRARIDRFVREALPSPG